MAAVDKCYVDNYNDYLEFKEWAKDKSYTTPRGCKVTISNYIFQWNKEDFDFDVEGGELPIFNSPIHFDNYLYHNCPLKVIQDWLAESYCGKGYCKGCMEDITCEPKLPEYTPCKKVKVVINGGAQHPIPFRTTRGKKSTSWLIEVYMIKNNQRHFLDYNETIDQWILPNEDDVWTCSCHMSKNSVKRIIKKIINKWKLPKGCIVTIEGRYVGDEWKLITK